MNDRRSGSGRVSNGPPDPTEEALVKGLIAGDDSAVTEFITLTHRPVFAMTCRLTHDPDLRQDWTHDVLLRVIEEMRRGTFVYQWPGCFWSWFRQRAHFLLLNQLNRNRKLADREVGGETLHTALETLAGAGSEDPAGDLERAEARAMVEHCLEGLGAESHRRALRLRLLDELPYEQIAAEMETPLNTIRSWLRRARIAMRECLDRQMGS